MSRRLTFCLTLCGLLGLPAAGQIPPGFELVDVTNDAVLNTFPKMNSRGQIVYEIWPDGGNTDAVEIMLYDNGVTTQLTDNNVYDRTPDISDEGVVCWSRATAGPGSPIQIVMWEEGELTQLTFSEQDNLSPRINSLGQVLWKRDMGSECSRFCTDLFFFDGQSVQRLTTTGESSSVVNQAMSLSDAGELAWTEYDFSVGPWESRVMLFSAGQITQVSDPAQIQPQGAAVNSPSQVAWSSYVPGGITMWDAGETTQLTDWGAGPHLNDAGDVAFSRWHVESQSGQAWLYRSGQWFQFTDDSLNNIVRDINAWGEVVIASGAYPETNIRYLRRLRQGAPTVGGPTRSPDPIIERRSPTRSLETGVPQKR